VVLATAVPSSYGFTIDQIGGMMGMRRRECLVCDDTSSAQQSKDWGRAHSVLGDAARKGKSLNDPKLFGEPPVPR